MTMIEKTLAQIGQIEFNINNLKLRLAELESQKEQAIRQYISFASEVNKKEEEND